MKVDILIPTLKPFEDVKSQVRGIHEMYPDNRVFATCLEASAAINRNKAHKEANTEIVISLDDDITGFYQGWVEDLIRPLKKNQDIRFVSARLMKSDGVTPNFMMTSKFNLSSMYEVVPRCPTSAFAYRKVDFDYLIGYYNESSKPFDENFKGSGWEDNAICHDLKQGFPGTLIVINNNCKLIHINEEKNQKKFFMENKKYFFESGRKEL